MLIQFAVQITDSFSFNNLKMYHYDSCNKLILYQGFFPHYTFASKIVVLTMASVTWYGSQFDEGLLSSR